MHLYSHILEESPVFCELTDPGFVTSILKAMHATAALPDDVIISEGVDCATLQARARADTHLHMHARTCRGCYLQAEVKNEVDQVI